MKMNEIVLSVERVKRIMGEVKDASQAQSAGIGQVNQVMEQMDQVTQQNAALVEQAAAAAESLHDQAGKLSELVGVFKLDFIPHLRGMPNLLPGEGLSHTRSRRTLDTVVSAICNKSRVRTLPSTVMCVTT